jgi:hypothetical protein
MSIGKGDMQTRPQLNVHRGVEGAMISQELHAREWFGLNVRASMQTFLRAFYIPIDKLILAQIRTRLVHIPDAVSAQGEGQKTQLSEAPTL